MKTHSVVLSLSTQEWMQLEIARANLNKPTIDQLIEHLIKERLNVLNHAFSRKSQ